MQGSDDSETLRGYARSPGTRLLAMGRAGPEPESTQRQATTSDAARITILTRRDIEHQSTVRDPAFCAPCQVTLSDGASGSDDAYKAKVSCLAAQDPERGYRSRKLLARNVSLVQLSHRHAVAIRVSGSFQLHSLAVLLLPCTSEGF